MWSCNLASFGEIDRKGGWFTIHRVPLDETLAAYIARHHHRYPGIDALVEFRRRCPGAVLHIDPAAVNQAAIKAHRMAGVGAVRIELDRQHPASAVDSTWVRVDFGGIPVYLDPAGLKPNAQLCGASDGSAVAITSCPPTLP